VNLHAHAESPPTLPRLAAAYGFALARGHCFPDGNKRVALAIIDVFLRMNGMELTADELDAVSTSSPSLPATSPRTSSPSGSAQTLRDLLANRPRLQPSLPERPRIVA